MPIIFRFRRLPLVVDGNRRSVDDPQFAAVGGWWAEEFGERPGESVDYAVHSRIGNAE